MSDEQATKSARGRPRREAARKRPATGDPIKPTASGQIEPDESEYLNRLGDAVSRTRSYLVRAAIVLLIRENEAGRLDWGKPPEAW